jgi:hypothetical protein
VNIQHHAAGSEHPVQFSQRVTDTLTRYSSQGPGEDRDIEPLITEANTGHIAGSESDSRPQELWCLFLRLGDARLVRVESQDRPR